MYQGETITTTIDNLPVPISEIANAYVIFANRSRIILEKTLKDCTVSDSGKALEVRLTQAETLSFPQGKILQSIIIITKDGSRFERDPCELMCGKTAKNEVLS